MSESVPSQRSIRTVRLDDDEVHKLLDRLDQANAHSGAERRKQRYLYRMKGVLLHMQQPGSTITVSYLAPTRNISQDGLSILHGGYVHGGTRVVVQLITTYGTWEDVPGKVINCNYIEANIHEVNIRFDHMIDPSAYCAVAVQSRVLLAEDDPAISRLAQHYLKQLNAEVDYVENGRDAIEKAMANSYDVILMDIEMPVLDGFGALKELRERGYTGTIIAATALTSEDDAQRCLDAGFDRYIAKPFTKQILDETLKSVREEPLLSAFHQDPNMKDLIDAYVEELPKKVRAFEQALVDGDPKAVELLARTFKGEGSSYGFDVITETAQAIEKSLQAGGSIAAARADIDTLLKLCLQARATPKRATAPPEAATRP